MGGINILFYKKIVTENSLEWLVMIHGFCGNNGMWKNQIKLFQNRYNILLIDLPGHGSSKLGLSDLGISCFKELGGEIAEILKKEGIKKADFIGASLGTMVIGGVLQSNPECVNKIILADAVIVANPISRFLLKIVEKVQYFIPFRVILYLGNFILMPFPYIRDLAVQKFYIKSGTRFVQREFNIWLSLIITELNILESIDYSKRTLFISGKKDLHFRKGVKRVAESHKNTRLALIKGVGHVCSMQDGQRFNKIISVFLRTGEVFSGDLSKVDGYIEGFQEIKQQEVISIS